METYKCPQLKQFHKFPSVGTKLFTIISERAKCLTLNLTIKIIIYRNSGFSCSSTLLTPSKVEYFSWLQVDVGQYLHNIHARSVHGIFFLKTALQHDENKPLLISINHVIHVPESYVPQDNPVYLKSRQVQSSILPLSMCSK